MVFENSRNPTEAETELYERHIMNKHEAYTALLIDSEDPSKTVVSFDLQQILPFPKLSTTKQAFDKSRMVCYNLCLYVKGTKRGYFVSWSQVEGGRGSNEIATCLKYFVENHLADSRHIVFYRRGTRTACPLYVFWGIGGMRNSTSVMWSSWFKPMTERSWHRHYFFPNRFVSHWTSKLIYCTPGIHLRVYPKLGFNFFLFFFLIYFIGCNQTWLKLIEVFAVSKLIVSEVNHWKLFNQQRISLFFILILRMRMQLITIRVNSIKSEVNHWKLLCHQWISLFFIYQQWSLPLETQGISLFFIFILFYCVIYCSISC